MLSSNTRSINTKILKTFPSALIKNPA